MKSTFYFVTKLENINHHILSVKLGAPKIFLFDIHRSYLLDVKSINVFHIKITMSVTRNLHQDCDPCYLHLPIFSYTYTLLFCCKTKSCCNQCFPQQIRPQTIVELCILQNYSSVRIGFSVNNKHHTLPIVYTILV